MQNLQLQDILTTSRFLVDEPSADGRFADDELINYVNLATIQMMLAAEWPEATYFWTSDGVSTGQYMELELPELYSVERVYVAGQLAVPTTIPILEGDPLGTYQQFGPARSPAWAQAPFTGYPVASFQGSPAFSGVPYFPGARPGFYFRGGALGLVPPPTAGYTVALDVYPAPGILANYEDYTFFPQLFKEALAYRTLQYAYFADQTDEGSSRSTLCAKGFADQMKTVILPWKSKFNRNLPNKPMPVPHRTFFQGPPRNPTGRYSRFGG